MDIVPITLQRVSNVATLPAIALRIIRIAENPTATSDELHDVLKSDPALAARVLKVVNSAFYGRPRQVASTSAAIQLLGVSAIRNIAVAASLTRMFRGGRHLVGFDASALWVHSVAVGAAAKRLAELSNTVPPEEALLAGLLHDIGVLVSMQAWMPEFSAVVAAPSADPALPCEEAEPQIVGADHEQFGEALCEQWRFPNTFSLVCGHHHDPLALPAAQRALPVLVHAADVIAARAGIGFCRTVQTHVLAPAILQELGLTEQQVRTVEDALTSDFSQAMTLFAA